MTKRVGCGAALICAAAPLLGCGVRVATSPRRPSPGANRPPTVHARCEPCSVEMGKLSTVVADASDPDRDPLTYRWSTPSGTLANPADRRSPWTAPMQEGAVPLIVEVRDSKGGIATDAITIQVVRPTGPRSR